MPHALETIIVKTDQLSCDGDDGADGHPRVYLAIRSNGSVDCPYCGRHFVLDAGAKKAAGH